MKSNKKYAGIVIANSRCPKKDIVLTDIENGNKIGKSIIAREIPTGFSQFPVYLDAEEEANIYACIKEMKDDAGNLLTADEISDLAGQEYILTPTAVNGNKITVEIVVTKAKSTSMTAERNIPVDIQELAEGKVADGIIDAEKVEKVLKVMMDNYVPLPIMRRVIKNWKTYNKPAHKLRCLYIDPYLEEKRKLGELGLIAQELSNALDGYAVIMEGDKSVGKNVFVETIAWILHMPLYLLTFSRNMSPSAVYGEKSTDNSASEYFKTPEAMEAAQAKQKMKDIEASIATIKETFLRSVINSSEFFGAYESFVSECGLNGDYLPLISADGGKSECALKMLGKNPAYASAIEGLEKEKEKMQKAVSELELKAAQAQSVNITIDASELYDWLIDGGLMVFNEMNMAEPNFFASFTNQLLDGTGFLFIPGRGEIPINPDCVLCGTQNADYEGVEQQNEATISRFGCLHFKQPESIKAQLKEAVKRELLNHGFEEDIEIKEVIYNHIENFYKSCRQDAKSGIIGNAVLNIRGFVRALAQYAENDGDMSIQSAIETHVINTCPTDDRERVRQTIKTELTKKTA